MEKVLFSAKEAAELLAALGYPKVTSRTLARLAAQGQGPAYARVANGRYYRREALVEFVEAALAETYPSLAAERAAKNSPPTRAAPKSAPKVAPAQPAPKRRSKAGA